MNNCSNHNKDLIIKTTTCTIRLNMKQLAKEISILHYGSLPELFYELSKNLEADARKDNDAGKEKTASDIQYLGMSCFESAKRAEKLFKTVKPFMND